MKDQLKALLDCIESADDRIDEIWAKNKLSPEVRRRLTNAKEWLAKARLEVSCAKGTWGDETRK